MEDPYKLRGIWEAELSILDEISAICQRHGLKYYLSDGVALGFIRHNGFIPWDDDLDISMPREDFTRFTELATSELPAHLKFVDWRNTPEFTLLMGKVQDSRENVVKDLEKRAGRKLSNGVYVDIFPIDGCPENKMLEWYIRLRDAVLLPIERFHLHAFSHMSLRGKCVWLLGMVMAPFFPWLWKQADFCSFHEKTLLQSPFASSRRVGRCCLNKNPYWRAPVSKEIWGEPKMVTLMGHTVNIPADLDAHLRNEYGEYMTLPPESKRVPSHSYSWRCPWWLGPTRGI